jgi:large subunit ribosomal protein L4
MNVPVYDRTGKATGENAALDEAVFGIEPNEHVMYLAVKAQRAHMRQGTHASKNRALVRGGGKKPWRQKGRGAARAGTIRSPLWRHGGTIFGPTPHPHAMGLPKKVNRLARRSALATRAKEEGIRVLEDFSYEGPKTRELVEMLKAMELNNSKVLILTSGYQQNIVKSAQNVANCNVRVGTEASTMDMLNHPVILIQKGALEPISEVLGGRERRSQENAEAAITD